jgi:putative SOS response-associated peptidase YedK
VNFSFAPGRPKGGPVFNFRSEGRNFSKSLRCLISASGVFEYVGTKYPKTQYRFSLPGAPFLAITGLWREAEGTHPVSFTMLTTSPGVDIAPYHDRQVVVLRPEDWAAWLYLSKPQAELLRPLTEGSLDGEMVRDGRA